MEVPRSFAPPGCQVRTGAARVDERDGRVRPRQGPGVGLHVLFEVQRGEQHEAGRAVFVPDTVGDLQHRGAGQAPEHGLDGQGAAGTGGVAKVLPVRQVERAPRAQRIAEQLPVRVDGEDPRVLRMLAQHGCEEGRTGVAVGRVEVPRAGQPVVQLRGAADGVSQGLRDLVGLVGELAPGFLDPGLAEPAEHQHADHRRNQRREQDEQKQFGADAHVSGTGNVPRCARQGVEG